MQINSTKRWLLKPEIDPKSDQALSKFPPILRQLLFNRGYRTYETALSYLQAQPPEGSEPWNLLGIPEAVDRIWHAIVKGEPITVYGDYDADGVTATALLTDVLMRLEARVQGYVPNRFDEGYGLNIEALDNLASEGVRLIITVDCGARSLEESVQTRQLGMDLIITDHHSPGPELPEAVAIINPKQPGETYPDRNLAGVGLAYKLASALMEKAGFRLPSLVYPSPAIDYLDLVALGTIADQAPLIGENRSLVRTGLEYIRKPHRQGVMSLIGAAQINPATISAESIGFILAPRLNAAGRLDSAFAALNLLLAKNVGEAAVLAQQLDIQNRERQEITRNIQAHAEETAITKDADALLLFAADESYNPGVIGLVAAKIAEKYFRPSIVAHQGSELTRGSCRSIPEFHITHALDRCADLLVRYGGHSAAAGFTVRNENLPGLIERLTSIASEELSHIDLQPSIFVDAEVSLSELTPEVSESLTYLEPTGAGNPQATFISHGVKVLRSRAVGRDKSHLKLTVTDGFITYDAIAFRLGHLQPSLPPFLDLLFTFERNQFNGNDILQLNVKDIHPSNGQKQFC